MKIIIGQKYQNIHSGMICKVIDKIFFNIQFIRLDGDRNFAPTYTHYKTFRKNWVLVEIGNGLPVQGG